MTQNKMAQNKMTQNKMGNILQGIFWGCLALTCIHGKDGGRETRARARGREGWSHIERRGGERGRQKNRESEREKKGRGREKASARKSEGERAVIVMTCVAHERETSLLSLLSLS